MNQRRMSGAAVSAALVAARCALPEASGELCVHAELDFNVIAAERFSIQGRWSAEFCADAADGPTSRCVFVVD